MQHTDSLTVLCYVISIAAHYSFTIGVAGARLLPAQKEDLCNTNTRAGSLRNGTWHHYAA
jgi:hypothetical protein